MKLVHAPLRRNRFEILCPRNAQQRTDGRTDEDEIGASNRRGFVVHFGFIFLEINGTCYLRVVLAPLDDHEKSHVRFRSISRTEPPRGGRRVKKKEEISDTRTLRTARLWLVRVKGVMDTPTQRTC